MASLATIGRDKPKHTRERGKRRSRYSLKARKTPRPPSTSPPSSRATAISDSGEGKSTSNMASSSQAVADVRMYGVMKKRTKLGFSHKRFFVVLGRNIDELMWYKSYRDFLAAGGEAKSKIIVMGVEDDGTRFGLNVIGINRVLHLEAPTTQMKHTWLNFLNETIRQSTTMKCPSSIGAMLFRVLTDQMQSDDEESSEEELEGYSSDSSGMPDNARRSGSNVQLGKELLRRHFSEEFDASSPRNTVSPERSQRAHGGLKKVQEYCSLAVLNREELFKVEDPFALAHQINKLSVRVTSSIEMYNLLSICIDLINRSDEGCVITTNQVLTDTFAEDLREALEKPLDELFLRFKSAEHIWTHLVNETYLELKRLLRKDNMIRNFNSSLFLSSDEEDQ